MLPVDIRSFIQNYTEEDLLEIMFAWNGKHAHDLRDDNLELRRKILDRFSEAPDEFPIELVRDLFEAETEFAREVWAVNPIVSNLAQALLERGAEKYVADWIKGLSRGMDAYCQSMQIELSVETAEKLHSYCTKIENRSIFPNEDAAEHIIKFFEHHSKQR